MNTCCQHYESGRKSRERQWKSGRKPEGVETGKTPPAGRTPERRILVNIADGRREPPSCGAVRPLFLSLSPSPKARETSRCLMSIHRMPSRPL